MKDICACFFPVQLYPQHTICYEIGYAEIISKIYPLIAGVIFLPQNSVIHVYLIFGDDILLRITILQKEIQ